MDAEIRPEPSLEERDAILAALEEGLPPEPDPRGEWWRTGLRESLRTGSASPRPSASGQGAGERVPPADE